MNYLPAFDYERAVDLDHALELVAGGAVPIAGGTELIPAMSLGLWHPRKVVSLRAVPELAVCKEVDRVLSVGAGLTHRKVALNADVRRVAPLLAEVEDAVGNIRVRSTGTLGGNIAFAEPRSDVTTALLALGGSLCLVSRVGERRLPLASFLRGPYEGDLRPGELIRSVEITGGVVDFAVYQKIVLSERPVVGVALAHLGVTGSWRLVVGAVGLLPVVFETDRLSDIDIARIVESIEVASDFNGSETYKRHLTAVTIERCREAAISHEHENETQ